MHKWVIDDNGNSFVHSTLDDGYTIKGNKIKGRFMGEYFEVDGLKLSPEELLQTCRCYEGWGFSLKFHDLSE